MPDLIIFTPTDRGALTRLTCYYYLSEIWQVQERIWDNLRNESMDLHRFVRFLSTEVGPDNPSVMAHCFPDHTAHSSAADEPESGKVHHVSGFTSRPVFLLSHSYMQFCLVLQLLGESERIISPLCFCFSRENQWPQMKGHFSRVALLRFKCRILGRSQISQSRSVLLQGPWDTLVAPSVKFISDYVGTVTEF